jgi:hypothetical protein
MKRPLKLLALWKCEYLGLAPELDREFVASQVGSES